MQYRIKQAIITGRGKQTYISDLFISEADILKSILTRAGGVVLLAIIHFYMDASIWTFFLELFVFEVAITSISFVIALMLAKSAGGRTAWQDLGALPLFVGTIIFFPSAAMSRRGGINNPIRQQLVVGTHSQ